jgi:hypothetical protein
MADGPIKRWPIADDPISRWPIADDPIQPMADHR